jgi:hypothetical protein
MAGRGSDADVAAALAASKVRAIRTALLALHKTLIDAERARYGRAHGPIENPHQALQLLLRDPWFAWLRPIAELIVQADERLADDRPVRVEEADAYSAQVLGLLQHEVGGADFRREYHRSLQETPEVVIAHSKVVTLAARDPRRGSAAPVTRDL